jgi:hypothetical protein
MTRLFVVKRDGSVMRSEPLAEGKSAIFDFYDEAVKFGASARHPDESAQIAVKAERGHFFSRPSLLNFGIWRVFFIWGHASR